MSGQRNPLLRGLYVSWVVWVSAAARRSLFFTERMAWKQDLQMGKGAFFPQVLKGLSHRGLRLRCDSPGVRTVASFQGFGQEVLKVGQWTLPLYSRQTMPSRKTAAKLQEGGTLAFSPPKGLSDPYLRKVSPVQRHLRLAQRSQSKGQPKLNRDGGAGDGDNGRERRAQAELGLARTPHHSTVRLSQTRHSKKRTELPGKWGLNSQATLSLKGG